MPSRREQILSAVETLLTGNTPAGANVFRCRVTSVEREASPAIVIRPEEDIPEKQFSGMLIWNLSIAIDIYTRGDVPDQLADAVIVSTHALIMADRTLGGLVSLVSPAPAKWEMQDADQVAGLATFLYRVTYTTEISDLTQ